MAGNYTESLIFTKNLDENGTPYIPKLIEVAKVSETGRIQCQQNIYKKNGIKIISPLGLKKVTKASQLVNETSSYFVYEDRAEVLFSEDLIDQVIVFEYYGTGNPNIGDCRVFTTVDNFGNITETLNDVIKDGRDIIESIKQLGGAIVILNKLEEVLQNAENLNIALGIKITVGTQVSERLEADIEKGNAVDSTLKATISKAEKTDSTVNATINTANATNEKVKTTINTANTTDSNLKVTINTANTTDEKVKTTISKGEQTSTKLEEQLTQINESENKVIQINPEDWVLNSETKMYEKIVIHGMGKTSGLIFDYQTVKNGKKCSYFMDYEIENENSIRFITESADTVFVTITAKYYTGLGIEESLLEVDKLVDGSSKVIMTRDERESLPHKINFTVDNTSNVEIPQVDEKLDIVSKKYDIVSSQLEHIETQKATKSDLDIQKKRIDSFISLKEGSTTGDAELIDGRIGNNGIIYNSIGNAIREQIHTIDNALNTKIGLGDDLNIPISSISMKVGRIQCTTGNIAYNVTDFSYITLDVNGYKSIEIDTSYLGANDLGYAFYDSSNTYISGSKTTNAKVIISIPDNAYFFRYGDSKTTWQTRISENKSIILINKDERSYKTLNERLINLEEYNKNKNKDYGINPSELGVMDNKLLYIWYGVGRIFSMTSTYSKPTDSRTSFVISTDFDGQSGVIRNKGTAYFTINKGNEVKYYKLRNQSGAECTFNSNVENGKVLYQNNTENKMGEIIYSDEEKFIVFIDSYSIPITFSCYSDSNRTIESPFDINLNKSAIFYKEYPKSQIDFDYKYLSRAEKLGSKIIGKNLFVFSDSQSSVIKPLAQDFGANIFSISNGGCRMGYVAGNGLGGESGSANSLWLCNKERTSQFNDFIYTNNINIDYIINFTGGNGDFNNIGNSEELTYVLNNKRWFGDRTDNDMFDSLSEENKLRFTSPLCYIASFITLNKLFPNAISVCVDLYGSVGNTLGNGKFENGVWKNNNDIANAIYNHDVRTLNKSRLIREISELIGAILVKASECGLNVINCPTYASDTVHANFKMATNLAYNIHKKIDFFNSIEEDYK